MKAGIAIEEHKLAIFDKHLTEAGYDYLNSNFGAFGEGILLLTVVTSDPFALQKVVAAANKEASGRGMRIWH